jgi:enterochelin esterase family protein
MAQSIVNAAHLLCVMLVLVVPGRSTCAENSEIPPKKLSISSLQESPRLLQLKKRVANGEALALSQFWAAMPMEHSPLFEPITNEPGRILVTFVWRAATGTTDVGVLGRQMTRLLDTDLWFLTEVMDVSTPIFYAFFPTVKGESLGRVADPFNPNRFVVSDEVLSAIPQDLKGDNSQWLKTSMLLFRESPSARWSDVHPGTPTGKIEMFTVEDKGNTRARRVWVYTPSDYHSDAKVPYRLLICFNGPSYLIEIPVPTILDNLIASNEIWPIIAVMVDNGSLKAAAEDLDNHAMFADFMGKELLPWIQKNWRVSIDPSHVILCGYSRGGSGAAYVAWKHPELFGNVLAQSGAFWRGNEGGVEDPEWLTQQIKHSPKVGLRFYIDVGSQETRATPGGPVFIEANRHLVQALQEKGYPVRYLEVAGARHDPIHWRSQVPEGLLFLAGKETQTK